MRKSYAIGTKGFFMWDPEVQKEFLDKAVKGESLEDASPKARGQVTASSATFKSTKYGLTTITQESDTKDEYLEPGELGNIANRRKVVKGQTSGKILAAGAKQAGVEGNDMGEGVKTLATVLEAVGEAFSPEAEETRAEKAAESFKAPASDIRVAAGVFSDAVKQFATIIGADDISKKKVSEAIQSMKKQGSGDSPKHHVVQPWDIKE